MNHFNPPLRPLKPPPAQTVTPDVSWWCDAKREGFTATATQHAERMRKSKEVNFVHPLTVWSV